MITLGEARDYLRIDGTDSDGIISPLLVSIPFYIKTTTGMSIAQQSTEPLADTVSKFLLALWYNAEGTETEKLERTINSLLKTLSAMVDNYAYEVQSSLEPWQWDPFSFEDGVIRDYFNIAVPGTLTIIGKDKQVCPKFVCSNDMTVTYLGEVYQLRTGDNQILDIYLGTGDHTLTFEGTGIVAVDYRGASL